MPASRAARALSDSDPILQGAGKFYRNLSALALVQESLRRGETRQSKQGPLVALTGKYTGRSPNDRFIVENEASRNLVGWGDVNRPISEAHFDRLYQKVIRALHGREIFVQDCFVGADPGFRIPLRVITEFAWQSLFARNMFVRIEDPKELEKHVPEFTILAAPSVTADLKTDGTNSEAFVVLNFRKKMILIGGTSYAGEIKKSAFSLMNFVLPQAGVLSMHCSANIGGKGDSAVFFGLSGTGKTTLSADPHRTLIGDDEHGWSDGGVFNFEAGCYAKVIHLSATAEPEIYSTTRRSGTILENVVMDAAGNIDLDDASITENTRASYPIDFIPNAEPTGRGGHPKNIIMLTCDAFGVMPPVAKLTPAQAVYYFLSGYTSKVAGTERGIKEPQVTFSACFGAPFMTLPSKIYADLLQKKIAAHKVDCWLVNTGWSGGPYGVGKRVAIADSRAIVNAALSGDLTRSATKTDPVFQFLIPQSCPGVSSPKILNPRDTWKNPADYDARVADLAARFHSNVEKFSGEFTRELRESGPRRPQ